MPTVLRETCANCRRETSRPSYPLFGDPMCHRCYNERFVNCGGCGAEEYRHNHSLTFSDTQLYCPSCLEVFRSQCAECGETADHYHVTPTQFRICTPCFERLYTTCQDCGMLVLRSDSRSDLCRDCYNRTEWSDRGFYIEEPSFSEIRSERRFGIEIETSACPEHITIRDETVFGCKPDGSVDGMEFVSPVLYGDEGLNEVRKICELGRRLNWQVDSACGLHLHVDLSNETAENCFKVAHAYHYTYDFWTSFISNARKQNYYCAKHYYQDTDLAGFSDFMEWAYSANGGERYIWCNWQSYTRHKTVELRHHSATLNGTKICNWVKAHTRFIDSVVSKPRAEIIQTLSGGSVYDQFQVISDWWNDSELSNFYKERAANFRKPFVREALVVA